MSLYPLRDHKQLWHQLKTASENPNAEQWDVVIVGGGISGAGVLREAARLGLRALLVEQQDFAWGTSSRSSKMVHGGLRYLAMGDITLTKHSLHERERLLQEAPGLVTRMGYYFTLRKKKSPPSWAVKMMLWLYDRIAGVKFHRSVTLASVASTFAGIDITPLKSAFYYTDAVTDDSRLVQRVIQEAMSEGGQAMNYVRVSGLLKDAEGEVAGVYLEQTSLEDSGTVSVRDKIKVTAKVVINATGAWADQLRSEVNPEKRVRPLRGSHIVLAAGVLPVDDAITLMHPEDNRAAFIFPWENRTVIGTTDLDHPESLDVEASISSQELDYLLNATSSLFPTVSLTSDDVISSWSGVRPVIGSEKNKDPSKERRNHAVWKDGRLITVSGGKLTTFRLIAQDALTEAASELQGSNIHKQIRDGGRVFAPLAVTALDLPACSTTVAELLLGRYGDLAKVIVDQAGDGELGFIADTRFCLAECRWILREESVQHLDDLLLRRTRLGLLLPKAAELIFPQVKELCQQELNWSDSHWYWELARYQNIWQKYYFVPTKIAEADNSNAC
jgi:glycerol-3-phosphate dehydrogenase